MQSVAVTDQIALWGAIGQVAAAAIGAVALILALLQLRDVRKEVKQSSVYNEAALIATRQQIADGRNAADAQAQYFLVEYLERPENLEIREFAARLHRTDRKDWPQDFHTNAEKLSGLWEVVAALVRSGVVSIDFVESIYGYAIRRHWKILEPAVEALRLQRGESEQRRNFEQLAADLEVRAALTS